MTASTGWGSPGIRQAADFHVPAVDLHHHAKWDCYPLPPESQKLIDASQDAIEQLAVAMEKTRTAREASPLGAQPELCGARAIGAVCIRPEHPTWEQHEDWEGNTWCSGQAPR